MRKKLLFFTLALLYVLFFPVASQAADKELLLKENLKRAKVGDYLVSAQNKNYTVLLARSKDATSLTFEEITVPMKRIAEKGFSWKRWIEGGAHGHTCRVLYAIDLTTGTMQRAYSYTKNEWTSIPQSQNFLATLLNLRLKMVPLTERKKVGPLPLPDSPDRRSLWQPKVIVNGQVVDGVIFDVWKTQWPKDGTDLSGKAIEIYVPKENEKYPSYFPYWLQVNGMVGKAKMRIVDTGSVSLPSRESETK
jgi:hypothetical protein